MTDEEIKTDKIIKVADNKFETSFRVRPDGADKAVDSATGKGYTGVEIKVQYDTSQLTKDELVAFAIKSINILCQRVVRDKITTDNPDKSFAIKYNALKTLALSTFKWKVPKPSERKPGEKAELKAKLSLANQVVDDIRDLYSKYGHLMTVEDRKILAPRDYSTWMTDIPILRAKLMNLAKDAKK